MPRSHGYRRKTRKVLRKERSARGLSYLLQDYRPGDRVIFDLDPSQHKGMPHRRYQGKVGEVVEVGRRSLVAVVRVGGKIKKIVARLEHVKPHKG